MLKDLIHPCLGDLLIQQAWKPGKKLRNISMNSWTWMSSGIIGHKEIVEITTPVLITWHDGKSRLGVDFRALNNYTKADRYPIPRIPHALGKFAKAKYITKMDCMKGFQQNGFKPNSMK
ncbi:hypothetical protein O181_071775 [Austropuccinia psidii MF-1]|uniref:Uncharacterized protein n=1 Tax=Austropuccinia psidii MF-1 TaxID=1389203 RepID=A0A9Q3IAC7_9BASI|nr:hypothetical protein [Austropuccinia psidii MF-1]